MVLWKLFLFLFLKGILSEEEENNSKEKDVNVTERSGVQLWRAKGSFEKDVLNEFQARAHFTEDIWKRDEKTIDFLIFDQEAEDMGQFLDVFGVSHEVLMDDVRKDVDEAVLAQFPVKRRNNGSDSGSESDDETSSEDELKS